MKKSVICRVAVSLWAAGSVVSGFSNAPDGSLPSSAASRPSPPATTSSPTADSAFLLSAEFIDKPVSNDPANVFHVLSGRPIKVRVTLSSTRNDGTQRVWDDSPQIFANRNNVPVALTPEHRKEVDFLEGGIIGSSVTSFSLRGLSPQHPFIWNVDPAKMIVMDEPGTYRVIFGFEVSEPHLVDPNEFRKGSVLPRPFFIVSPPLEIVVEEAGK